MIRFTLGFFSLILAVGCIDGGYNGVPMNDNCQGFGGFRFFVFDIISWALHKFTVIYMFF